MTYFHGCISSTHKTIVSNDIKVQQFLSRATLVRQLISNIIIFFYWKAIF